MCSTVQPAGYCSCPPSFPPWSGSPPCGCFRWILWPFCRLLPKLLCSDLDYEEIKTRHCVTIWWEERIEKTDLTNLLTYCLIFGQNSESEPFRSNGSCKTQHILKYQLPNHNITELKRKADIIILCHIKFPHLRHPVKASFVKHQRSWWMGERQW